RADRLRKGDPMHFRSLRERLMRPNSKSSQRRPVARTCPLAVEQLEERCTPAAMLAVTDLSSFEGNTGTHNAMVMVTVSEPHANSITVNYNTTNGSAAAGSDFRAVSGKLTFARTEMSKSILIPIQGDRLRELDESFSVRLSNPKGAKIADGEGIVTIVDDEP